MSSETKSHSPHTQTDYAKANLQAKNCQTSIGLCLTDLQSLADTVGRGSAGREVSLAITQLQQTRHWLRDAQEIIEQQIPTSSAQ